MDDLVERLREEAARLSGRSIERGCVYGAMSDRLDKAFADLGTALDELDGSIASLGHSLDELEHNVNSMASRTIAAAVATGFAVLLILILALHFSASAIEAQRAATVQQGVVHESAVPEGQTPEPGSRGPDNG